MSHVVKLTTVFKEPEVVRQVCERRRLPHEIAPAGQRLRRTLYGTEVEGVMAFELPDWHYPVVIDEDGVCRFDNFGGEWGEQARLDEFSQDYAKSLLLSHYEQQGYRVTEEITEADGTLQLQLVN